MLQNCLHEAPQRLPIQTPTGIQENSEPQPKHGGGMGRRPTIQYRAQCGPSSLLLRVSVARCPKALAPRMSPCRVFQIRLRFRGLQKSSSRPRRRPAEGLRKLAEVNRRRSGRRKPAEARLRPAENNLVFQDRSMLATVPCSGLQSLPNTYGVHKSPICSMLYFC